MKRFSKMFEMFIIFVGLVVILSCSNQVQDFSSDITYDFSSDGEPIDVIILAGQSNATGCADYDQLKDYITDEDYSLFTKGFSNQKIIGYLHNIYNAEDSEKISFSKVQFGQGNEDTNFGLEIGISYILNKSNKKNIIIKYTAPGASINFFIVNNKMNFSFETFLKESLSDIVEMGYSPSIKALCWMQGETDSILKSTAEQYEKNMILLLYDIRNKFGQDISFIDAQITDWDRVTPNSYQYLVNNAKIRIAAVGSNNYIVDSIGLTKKEDDVAHYDSVSEFELGKRFGNIILNICY